MTAEQIEKLLEILRYLANAPRVDKVIANHARGILIRIATQTGKIEA